MYTVVAFSYHTTSVSDQMLAVGTITARNNSFLGFKKYCCNIFHGRQLFNGSPRYKNIPMPFHRKNKNISLSLRTASLTILYF